jgi:excisionase family DNA binding protein
MPDDDKKQEGGEVIRLSVSEAARLFGVSTQTIRRAIQLKEIVYIVVAGRYKINFESLVKWSQEKTTVRHKLANDGIGQYVAQWKIRNTLYSPNANKLKKKIEPKLPEPPTPPAQAQ